MADWRFTLKRTAGFMRILLKSKMAAAGLFILVAYVFLAVAAPVLTPHDPRGGEPVAGALSPPSWYRFFGEGSRLSENQILEQSPGFAADPTEQGWIFTASNPSIVTESFDPDTSISPGSGSLLVSLDRSTPVTGSLSATLKKAFQWNYDGPPARFVADGAILTPTASSAEPIRATLFIERLSDMKRWNLTSDKPDSPFSQPPFTNPSWNGYPLHTTTWHRASHTDSNDDRLRTILGVDINPAQLVFSSREEYAYGITVVLTSTSSSTEPLQVFLDQLNLQLYGNAWGLLGTQIKGYDLFSQLIYGARISLIVGLLSAFIGIVVGLIVGLVAGYMGRLVDEVLMRFTDMLLVIPTLPLLIVLLAVLGNTLAGGGVVVLILVIGFLGWMGFARVVRAQVLSLKERPFVEAAKAAGAGTGYITARHIIPNIVGLIYVNLALAVPGAILTEAALSFLGLGDVTVLSWGRMLNEVQTSGAQRAWWWVLPPGISIALVSLAFVMIGFSLDTLFNPKLRQRR